MEFQKRVLIKLKSFQQVIGNSPPTVKHVCLPKYKSNFVWFWVPTWFFFESEQCHGLQKGHIARAKLPCCRVATLDSILNLIFYPEFDFDFLNCYLGQWFILVPSLPKGDQISKLFWLLSHLKKKPHNRVLINFSNYLGWKVDAPGFHAFFEDGEKWKYLLRFSHFYSTVLSN